MELTKNATQALHSSLVAQIYGLMIGLQNGELFFKQHFDKISANIFERRPLEFVLPAFPAKSANREKALGKTADLADYLGLKKLNDFAAAVSEIYSPGCTIHVCSDGRVFAGLVGVSDADVNMYSKSVRDTVKKAGMKHLTFFNLEDIFTITDFDQLREDLDEKFAEPLSSLKLRVKNCEDTKFLFNGIHRFLFEDYLQLRPELSRNKVRNLTKDLAYKVIQRSNSWSRLVEGLFPQAIRFSIHPQIKAGAKFPVQLVKSKEFWRTPWHSTAVFDGDSYSLMTVQDAKRLGGQVRKGTLGLPYFHVERGLS